jgi:hypothetical protein
LAKRRKQFSWYEKLLETLVLNNPRATLTGAIVLVLALFVGVNKGCRKDGGAVASAPKPPTNLKSVTAKVTVKASKDASPEPPSAKDKEPEPLSIARTKDVKREEAAKPKKAVRPKDITVWEQDDYASAARDGDPQLVKALGYFGGHFAGQESSADFLATLLTPPDAATVAEDAAWPALTRPSPAQCGPRNPPSGKPIPKLAEAVVAALAANATPRARKILTSIADGTLKTAGQSEAAIAALKALAAHPDQEMEDLLFHIVTAQGGPADDPAARDSAKLKSTAIGLIHAGASESLLVRLAKWMLGADISNALRDQLLACLKEPRLETLAAQVILYQNNRSDEAGYDWLEPWLAACGSNTMGRLMGIPASLTNLARSAPARGSAAGGAMGSRIMGGGMGVVTLRRRESMLTKTLPATASYRLAELLWSNDQAGAIERRLRTMETFDKGAPLMALAAATPSPTVRAAMQRTLERHWDEGPRGLHLLGTTEDVNVEPGFVAVVKLLCRNHSAELAVGENSLGRNGNRPHSATPATRQLSESLENKKRQEKLGQEWMDFTQAILKATCQRFYAAARTKSGGDRTADDADLPFKLRPRADVVAVYRLDWPAELNCKSAAAPVLRVHYVRSQEKTTPVNVLAYYRRQVFTGKEHILADGRWIDSVVIDKERTRSVDVLVTKTSNSVLGPLNQEQELTVDILTIECEGLAKPSPVSASR